MKSPPEQRRARIAELRKAVIRAHPDHGGTTESLQRALELLRAEVDQVPGSNLSNESIKAERPRHPPTTRKRNGLLSVIVGIALSFVKLWLGIMLASMFPLLVIRLFMMIT